MDRRLLLAIALSAVVVIAYQEYLRIYYPQATGTSDESQDGFGAAPVSPARAPLSPPSELPQDAPASEIVDAPEGDIEIETRVFAAKLSSRGGRLVSLRLKKYRATLAADSPGLELVSAGTTDWPLGVTLRGKEAWSDRGVVYQPSTSSLILRGEESGALILRGELPGGGEIEKHLLFAAGRYDFTTGVRVRAPSGTAHEVSLGWVREVGESSGYQFQGIEALVGKKIRHFDLDELAQGVVLPDPRAATATPSGPVRWTGYSDTYFLSAILPRENDDPRLWLKRNEDGAVSAEVLVPIAAAYEEPYPFTVFVGPKDFDVLDQAGHDLARSVELGWFSFVAAPMLRALKLFHGLTGNYGVDIILLTILIKVLFIPLTHKSFQSMQQMQKLQPQMKKLQEKYKDDREQLNKEMMELYRRHKVNPLGGCLPMLLQMPIFIGLYNALLNAVELRHAPFALWINDLSAPDRLPALPAAPLGELFGYEMRVPVLTLLMGASMLIQQRMTPSVGDPTQQRMMMFMPIVFTVMFVNFPSGLVLYWLVNNILTIAQQAWMQRTATK